METRSLRYNYRLRVSKTSERKLLKEASKARWVWNKAVEVFRDTSKWVTDQDLACWRKEIPWLSEGSSIVQQQVLRSFRGTQSSKTRQKKFKSSKKSLASLNYTRRGFSVKGNYLRLAKGIPLTMVVSRELPSTPSSVRVFQDYLGHWYASFIVQVPVISDNKTKLNQGIGVDWGVKAIATTTEPDYDLSYQAHMRNAQADLARMQRVMARRCPKPGQPASRGYKEAKRRVAKLHKKVARQRKDTGVKWVKKVVDNHGLIAVEDFKPKFLAKTRMAKKAADAGIGQLKRELVERGTRAGRKVVLVPPAYTTMTCSDCGTRAKSRLLLSERTFACESCGLVMDRDRNAARVILARAGFNPASVEAIRPASPTGLAGMPS